MYSNGEPFPWHKKSPNFQIWQLNDMYTLLLLPVPTMLKKVSNFSIDKFAPVLNEV